MKRYRVHRGLNYTPPKGKTERRAEQGDMVDDLPKSSVPWLLDRGVISPAPELESDEGGDA